MKSTELIKELNDIVQEHGDLPVYACSMDDEIKTISILNDEGCDISLYKDTKAAMVFLEC